jgi:hypothetical protein
VRACVSICVIARACVSAYAWFSVCVAVRPGVLNRTHGARLRDCPWQGKERGWRRVEGGVRQGCHEEVAQSFRAESAGPRPVEQRTAVDMQQRDEAWKKHCRAFQGGEQV